jgi:DNA-directed RNA polymerase specialized sigma24 family protein
MKKEKIMMISNLLGPSAFDSDPDVEEILKQHDTYIVDLARKKVPRNVVRPEMLRDEIDELAQRVRFKLWLTLRKKRINNLRAYIRSVVYTEVINMVRQYQAALPLPLDEDGELYQGNIIATPGEGMQDPAYEIEQEEAIDDYMTEAVEAVVKLPPRQQQAMICSLIDKIDDVLPLIDTLRNHAINIEEVNWPEESDELQRLQASLSIARKKLRKMKGKFV